MNVLDMKMPASPQEITVLVLGGVMTIAIFALVIYLVRRILRGEGDDFIAGYNTLSNEEKSKYDIVRVRKSIGYGCYACLAWTVIYILVEVFWHSVMTTVISFAILAVMIIVMIYIANTWTKKK